MAVPTSGRTGVPADVPPDAHEQITAAQKARYADEQEAAARRARPVLEEFSAQKRRLITPEIDRKLVDHAAGLRLPEDASKSDRLRSRARQRAYAADLGVDLAALERLRADFGRRLDQLPGPATTGGDLSLTGRQPIADGDAAQPAPGGRAMPWNGWWDAGYAWHSSHASQFALWNTESYHERPTSRAGSNLRFRQRETDNFDDASLTAHNGYMVYYTFPQTDGFQVFLHVRCHISRFFVDCDNEPGNSACWVKASQHLVVEVYDNWSDYTPREHVETQCGPSAFTTDTEAWQDWASDFPGARTLFGLENFRKYKAGTTVALYVGMSNRANAYKLDDTRCTLGVNAGWYMESLTVASLNWA